MVIKQDVSFLPLIFSFLYPHSWCHPSSPYHHSGLGSFLNSCFWFETVWEEMWVRVFVLGHPLVPFTVLRTCFRRNARRLLQELGWAGNVGWQWSTGWFEVGMGAGLLGPGSARPKVALPRRVSRLVQHLATPAGVQLGFVKWSWFA